VLPATPFVFIAYAFVWVALIGYLFGLWRKLTRVERELAQVASRVEARRTP
jgi:CcmD family protein